MAKGPIFGLDRPFAEEEEDTIKIIAQYSKMITSQKLKQDSQLAIKEIEEMDLILENMRVDAGRNSFLVIEMAATNIRFPDLAAIRDELMDIDGFKGMTVSTVNINSIPRLAQMR